jgi:hypothetical protein
MQLTMVFDAVERVPAMMKPRHNKTLKYAVVIKTCMNLVGFCRNACHPLFSAIENQPA